MNIHLWIRLECCPCPYGQGIFNSFGWWWMLEKDTEIEIEVAEMRVIIPDMWDFWLLSRERLVGSGGTGGYWWPITITYKPTPVQQKGRELGKEAIKRIQ